MSKPTGVYALAAGLAVDAADPNAVAPSETRIFETTASNDTAPYVLAIGGPVTVQLWAYVATPKRWFKVGAVQVCAVDALTYLPTIPPMDIGSLFLQVTVNAGSACTSIHWGFQGKR